jgi:hypothetical protein
VTDVGVCPTVATTCVTSSREASDVTRSQQELATGRGDDHREPWRYAPDDEQTERGPTLFPWRIRNHTPGRGWDCLE